MSGASRSRMLVEANPHQTSIAVLENERLTELFLERHRHRSLVGNLYKGRVTRVLPGMQAAFVDIGLERDAFLYVSDVGEPRVPAASGEIDLDETQAMLPEGPAPAIEELLREGQELLVQVMKAPLPGKGARISTQVTLPGRYLVYLPALRHFGVSRRIEDEAERQRLLALLGELAPPQGGLIARTVGEGKGGAEFEPDLAYLLRQWEQIGERLQAAKAPAPVHEDLPLALRVVRDRFGPEVSELVVDGDETYALIVEFLGQVQPALVDRVRRWEDEDPLFDRFGIPGEIEAALKSRVWLDSGGYLVINQTEALVAIDVNTGRYTGERNLEETVLKTNLEAVAEAVRQIRLRDLGGIIVIDFIDMTEEDNRSRVFAALEAELGRDRARTKVLAISEFGLVEITRKRSRVNLERLLTQPCPYCAGAGRIKSVATLGLELRRDLLSRRGEPPERGFVVRLHPEVARALQHEERAILEELRQTLGVPVAVESDRELHQERYVVEDA